MEPTYWQEAENFLSRQDSIMSNLVETYGKDKKARLRSLNNNFATLIKAIIGQQISIKAADALWNRLSLTVNNKFELQSFYDLDEQDLKQIGLSGQKICYIINLVEFLTNNQHFFETINKMEDKEAIEELCKIKGIGNWTAHMYLIFNQLRPDILPIGDIGLIKAINNFYKTEFTYSPKDRTNIILFSEKWKPYRTVATWYLWRTYDDVPVYY